MKIAIFNKCQLFYFTMWSSFSCQFLRFTDDTPKCEKNLKRYDFFMNAISVSYRETKGIFLKGKIKFYDQVVCCLVHFTLFTVNK